MGKPKGRQRKVCYTTEGIDLRNNAIFTPGKRLHLHWISSWRRITKTTGIRRGGNAPKETLRKNPASRMRYEQEGKSRKGSLTSMRLEESALSGGVLECSSKKAPQ